MMDNLKDDAQVFLFAIATVTAVFALYTLLVWLPVSLYADVKCLEKGFTDSTTTVTLTNYCLLSGVVAPL
jgi:hypothetical protein